MKSINLDWNFNNDIKLIEAKWGPFYWAIEDDRVCMYYQGFWKNSHTIQTVTREEITYKAYAMMQQFIKKEIDHYQEQLDTLIQDTDTEGLRTVQSTLVSANEASDTHRPTLVWKRSEDGTFKTMYQDENGYSWTFHGWYTGGFFFLQILDPVSLEYLDEYRIGSFDLNDEYTEFALTCLNTFKQNRKDKREFVMPAIGYSSASA